MRVAILTRDYPPAIGGIATHVGALVRSLREIGVEAHAYVGGNDMKTLLFPFDIPLKNYDLVHVQSAPYGAFVAGLPMALTVHSPVMEEFNHYRNSVKIMSVPAIALERISLGRASVILTVSAQTSLELQSMYKVPATKMEVIGNGVDLDRFSRVERREDRPTRRIATVSRLEPRKNLREAIEVVASLPKDSCTLEIAGDGSERTMLRELIRSLGADDRIRLIGQISSDDIPEFYARSDVFLSTSNSEGFGLSLLEAMASGCACVVSDLPTHRALVSDGQSGIVYKDKLNLSQSLLELLSSPARMKSLGEAARRVAAQYSWEKVAARVKQGYDRALAGPRRASPALG